jgi:phosphatidate phosphatase PAH1
MRTILVLAVAFLAACDAAPDETTPDPQEVSGLTGTSLADVRCTGTPSTGAAGRWRHWTSFLTAGLGSPRHRGIDLVATSSETTQTLRGEISYGVNDKALEDEWVQVYACRSGAWTYLGPVLTDDEGRFALTLSGSSRLPVGQRDLFVSVFGDRTSARFIGLVAPSGTPVAVSDVDGTLTASENAFPESLVTGATVAPQPGAAAALRTLASRGYPIVYITSRGRYFAQDTRAWLEANGFPRGPMRLADSIVTLPGAATVDYKVGAMTGLGLPVSVGVGNRETDIQAYARVGVAPDRIFVRLPEFASEVQADLDRHAAVGVRSYDDANAVFATY